MIPERVRVQEGCFLGNSYCDEGGLLVRSRLNVKLIWLQLHIRLHANVCYLTIHFTAPGFQIFPHLNFTFPT